VDSVRQKTGIQRVRIGLTGLASVFLAVLLAAVFTGRTHDEGPIGPNTVTRSGPGAATQSVQPADPLEALGLTPSNPDSNAAAPTGPNAPPAGRR
jgi:hypothetical protein